MIVHKKSNMGIIKKACTFVAWAVTAWSLLQLEVQVAGRLGVCLNFKLNIETIDLLNLKPPPAWHDPSLRLVWWLDEGWHWRDSAIRPVTSSLTEHCTVGAASSLHSGWQASLVTSHTASGRLNAMMHTVTASKSLPPCHIARKVDTLPVTLPRTVPAQPSQPEAHWQGSQWVQAARRRPSGAAGRYY